MPLEKSLRELTEAFPATNDQLDAIEAAIEANGSCAEKMEKSLRRELDSIRNEALPERMESLRQHLSAQADVEAKKILTVIDEQSINNQAQLGRTADTILSAISTNTIHQSKLAQSVEALKAILGEIHEASLGEIRTNRELNQQAAEALKNQGDASKQLLAAGVQNLIKSLDTLSAQMGDSEKSLAIINEFSMEIHTRLIDIRQSEQSILTSMEANHGNLTRLLAEQNSALVSRIAVFQARLKNLAIMTSILFTSILGYFGYGVWSKFN